MEFIPIIGLDAFLEEHSLSRELQYHEILGERIIERPHKHDFYVFLLVECGRGYHRIDGMNYKIGKNQLHVLFPGQVHDWKFDKTTRAVQLMINEQSVKEIAYALGFEDPAYFSNVFRLKAGETPAAFRKKL